MSLITFGVTLSGVSYLCQDAAELWASGRAHSCCVVLTPDITPSLSGSTAQASILKTAVVNANMPEDHTSPRRLGSVVCVFRIREVVLF